MERANRWSGEFPPQIPGGRFNQPAISPSITVRAITINGVSFDRTNIAGAFECTASVLSTAPDSLPLTGNVNRPIRKSGLRSTCVDRGAPMTLIAEDGNPCPACASANEVFLAAGKTYDVAKSKQHRRPVAANRPSYPLMKSAAQPFPPITNAMVVCRRNIAVGKGAQSGVGPRFSSGTDPRRLPKPSVSA